MNFGKRCTMHETTNQTSKIWYNMPRSNETQPICFTTKFGFPIAAAVRRFVSYFSMIMWGDCSSSAEHVNGSSRPKTITKLGCFSTGLTMRRDHHLYEVTRGTVGPDMILTWISVCQWIDGDFGHRSAFTGHRAERSSANRHPNRVRNAHLCNHLGRRNQAIFAALLAPIFQRCSDDHYSTAIGGGMRPWSCQSLPTSATPWIGCTLGSALASAWFSSSFSGLAHSPFLTKKSIHGWNQTCVFPPNKM